MTQVHRDAFINKIRELGYSYKNQQKRTQLWRKKGGTHRMFVPLSDFLEDDYVKSSLSHAGLTDEKIKEFMAQAKS